MEGSLRRWGIVAGALAFAGGGACAALMNIEEPTLVDEAGASPDGSSTDAPNGGDDSGGPVGPTSCTQMPDSCPPQSFCTAENVCAFGCRTDADCLKIVANGSAPKCAVDRHECVECLTTTPDCASKPGTVCSPGGACVASCTGDSGTCDAGTCCSGFCVDTLTDVKNCNMCGKTCSGGSPHCCGGTCADTTTSTTSCGGCNVTCGAQNASKTSCNGGLCTPTCNTGFAHCNTMATTGCETNTTTDPAHCGSCATNCNTKVVNATTIACVGSKCTYNGACTDFHYDANGDKSDGCEAACGASGMGCCPNGPQCMPGLMCNPAQGCK